jgi:hypothetical protein
VTTKVSWFDDIYRTIPGNIMLVHGSRKYCYVDDNQKILKFGLRTPFYFNITYFSVAMNVMFHPRTLFVD